MYIPSQLVLSFLNLFASTSKPSNPLGQDGFKAPTTKLMADGPGICQTIEGTPRVDLGDSGHQVFGTACELIPEFPAFPDERVFHKFLNIPFAEPSSRFRLPLEKKYNEDVNGTVWGPTCPQQGTDPPDTLPCPITKAFEELGLFPDEDHKPEVSEDCLTVNVVKPDNASNLPVVVWIFGGGFQVGAPNHYPGESIAGQARFFGVPSVFVSINYRVGGWGFLASQEVKDAGVGNLGIQDQRLALKWVQKYIRNFGGDPSRVTIWGVSSGAISAGLHMVAKDHDKLNLFSGVFMQSGGPIPLGDLSKGQEDYDAILEHTGCTSEHEDTLECLRAAPYELLKEAIDSRPAIFSENSLKLTWLPRLDGVLFDEDPLDLIERGDIANVPFVAGAVDDEGTFFSLGIPEVRTDEQFRKWLNETLLPGISPEEVDEIAELYPDDLSAGSPFNTGNKNALTPQFKRASAFQGDAVFQGPRRYLLEHRADKQPAYAYLSKFRKSEPFLGAFHGSDLEMIWGGGKLPAPLLGPSFAQFVATGEPGVGWDRYDPTEKIMIGFDEEGKVTQYSDTYRKNAMEKALRVVRAHPV